MIMDAVDIVILSTLYGLKFQLTSQAPLQWSPWELEIISDFLENEIFIRQILSGNLASEKGGNSDFSQLLKYLDSAECVELKFCKNKSIDGRCLDCAMNYVIRNLLFATNVVGVDVVQGDVFPDVNGNISLYLRVISSIEEKFFGKHLNYFINLPISTYANLSRISFFMHPEISMNSFDGSVIWLILNSPSIMQVSLSSPRGGSPFSIFSRMMVKHGLKLSSFQNLNFGNTPHRLTPLGYLLLQAFGLETCFSNQP